MFDVIVVQGVTMEPLTRQENIKLDTLLKVTAEAARLVAVGEQREIELAIRRHDPR